MVNGRMGWLVAVALALTASPAAHGADSLEDGVAELAQQIISKSAASERMTLAVSAFPHADDTCSELSNYLVDELVLSLFEVDDGRLQIIERSQLERIFAELELSLSGAVDANTTKELGRIYGVDSLLIGSLTVLGDKLRVISRLIETETGQVFSAAATNIPKTATIVSLMERPAADGCTLAGGSRSAEPQQAAAQASATSPKSGSAAALTGAVASTWDGFPQQTLEGLTATVTSASASTANSQYTFITLSLVVRNTSDHDIRLLLIGPEPRAVDDNGNFYELSEYSGTTMCTDLRNNRVQSCMTFEGKNDSVTPGAYTQVPREGQLSLTYAFWANKTTPGEIVSFSSNFSYLVVQTDDDGKQKLTLRSVSIGIPNIPIKKKT